MQSFLIVAKDKNLASTCASDLLKKNSVDPIDADTQIYEKMMGIEDVRNIHKAILLKPFRGKTKAVTIEADEGITPEAQNALLKILEEPPANTILIITTAKKDLILPTIISRCTLVSPKEKEIKLTDNDVLALEQTLDTLMNGKTGDKLEIAQDVTKNKGDVFLWLEKMAILVKNKLPENNNSKYLSFLRELQKTYKTIKSTNVSQRAALENLFLSL